MARPQHDRCGGSLSRAGGRCLLAAASWAGLWGCGQPEPLRVVARGRWVELVTDRDEPVCGGTVAFFDRVLEQGFALIGEEPPDGVFVRYERLHDVPELGEGDPIVGKGVANIVGDGIVIRSDLLVSEHELAHAVQLQAWPRTCSTDTAVSTLSVGPRDGSWTTVLGGEIRGVVGSVQVRGTPRACLEQVEDHGLPGDTAADDPLATEGCACTTGIGGAPAGLGLMMFLGVLRRRRERPPLDVIITEWAPRRSGSASW